MRPRCGAKEVSATWDSSEIGHGAYRFTDFPRTTGSTEVEAIASVGDERMWKANQFWSVATSLLG